MSQCMHTYRLERIHLFLKFTSIDIIINNNINGI